MATLAGTDVQALLNPTAAAKKFLWSGLDSTAASALLANAQTAVYACLPEVYRRLKVRATGYVLTREATQGQASFSIPTVLQTASTVTVWRNLAGVYGDRKVADAEASTLAGSTVTLDEACDEGDVVVCDVVHNFANPPAVLKRLAAWMVVSDIVTGMPNLMGDTDRTHLQAQIDAARADMRDLRAGRLRIDEWDELDFVRENETVTVEGPTMLYPTGW